MGKPCDIFSESYIDSLIDTSKLPKLHAQLTMAMKKFNQMLEYDKSNPIPFESSDPPTISQQTIQPTSNMQTIGPLTTSRID